MKIITNPLRKNTLAGFLKYLKALLKNQKQIARGNG